MVLKHKQKKKNAIAEHGSNGRYFNPFRVLSRSLSYKLFFSTAILFTFSALLTMIVAGKFIHHSAKNITLQQLQVLADNKIKLLEMWLEEKRQSCAEVAESPYVTNFLVELPSSNNHLNNLKSLLGNDALESYLRRYLKYHDEFRQILILDNNKNPVVAIQKDRHKSTSGLFESIDLLLFLDEVSAPKVSDPFLHPITGDPTGIVASRLHAENGRLLGYMIIEIELDHFEILLHHFDVGNTGKTYVVNKRRVLITQSKSENKNEILHVRVSTPGIESAFQQSISKGMFENYQGVEVLGVYRYIPDMEWVLAAEVDLKEALNVESIIRKAAIIPVIIAFLVILVLIQFVLKSFLSPLHEMKKQITIMATGDLRGQVEIKSQDEIGQLAISFNNMSNALSTILLKLQELMRTFKGSVSHIGVSLEEHDQTAAQQVTALEQTSESLDELNLSAGSVLKNAREVQTRVEETVQAILNLSSKATEIKEISSSIDEVSVKINLLSLNASIEAARAGKQGRGFGVVAGEIRKLADSTNELTEKISNMIADVQKLVQSTMLSAEVMVSEVMQIGSSVENQTTGTSQISTAIEGIHEGTIQSAKGASEISNAVNELQEMAHQINEFFQHFQLNEAETVQGVETETAEFATNLDDNMHSTVSFDTY